VFSPHAPAALLWRILSLDSVTRSRAAGGDFSEVTMANRISLATLLGISLVLAALVGSPARAEAQFGKRLKERLKQNAEDKAIQGAVNEQDKAIDAATTGGGEDSTTPATGRLGQLRLQAR
jgi:hypothetical protein